MSEKAALPVLGPAEDPRGLVAEMQRYLAWLDTRRHTIATVRTRRSQLTQFVGWCQERGVQQAQEVTRPMLERYQRHLFLYRQANGEALSGRSQAGRLTALRGWFRWLVKQNRLLSNPAADLDMPHVEKRLPRHVLSAAQAEVVMAMPDITNAVGIRDRAILETLYSTGIRRMELMGLAVHDVDAVQGTVMVRQGKGRRDRLIPIGERALAWIGKYVDEVRREWMLGDGEKALFLTVQGQRLSSTNVGKLVRDYIAGAGLEKSGSCHVFRHTMATLMLENGADVRFVQAMLGHADLKTTQVYTQVAIRALKEIHRATHPARLVRVSGPREEGSEEA